MCKTLFPGIWTVTVPLDNIPYRGRSAVIHKLHINQLSSTTNTHYKFTTDSLWLVKEDSYTARYPRYKVVAALSDLGTNHYLCDFRGIKSRFEWFVITARSPCPGSSRKAGALRFWGVHSRRSTRLFVFFEDWASVYSLFAPAFFSTWEWGSSSESKE